MVRVCLVGAPPSTTPPTTQGQNEWSYWALGNEHRKHDLHGFADSRLALVRRSMIARRTQARLREKRRRNRTVALSPEDDRRSSFISTFLADTKQLQDQGCQVPSENSTLSNKNEKVPDKEEVKNVLPREFDLIAKQMELQDTSSGCWSGGSTIQGRSGGFDASTPTPKLLLQELNEHTLMRHNAASSQASSRESEDQPVKTKPEPPRRSLSSRPTTLEYDIDPKNMEQSEINGFFAPIVLTPSNPSETDFEQKFIFPSPPKPANSISAPSSQSGSSLVNSPARSSSVSSNNAELEAKLARRLNQIELIESGSAKAFEKEDLEVEKQEQFTLKPVNLDATPVLKMPPVSAPAANLAEEEAPSVEVIWDADLSTNPIPEPITPIKTPTSLTINSDSDCSEPKSSVFDSPLSSPCRYQVRPMVIQPSLQITQSLMERGRTQERQKVANPRKLNKTNSANFKSLLLRSIGSTDKTARSSAAERLKVAPGMTLQDLYRSKSTDSSPSRKLDTLESSPRKVRNKSKNRYNTLHRLTSIVEEKDILAAKELIKSNEEVFEEA